MNLLCKSIDNMQTFSSRRKVESESESSEHSEPEEITDPKNNPKERQEKNLSGLHTNFERKIC